MPDNRLRALLFWLGRIFSPLYGLVMMIRAFLYARGLLASTKLPLPVISVGNLTMGGTGKTPMVIYVARLLATCRHPGIVSRGYRGRSRQPLNLVADGQRILMPPEEAGDEPVLLAQSLPGVPVVTARQRALGGSFLCQQGLADILIMDDGFQHLALQRDLDLVLFSAQTSMSSAWIFPGGMLREPPSALARADCFVLTGIEEGVRADADSLRQYLQENFPQTPLFEGRYASVAITCLEQGRVGLSELRGAPLFAFCGIANPKSFHRTLLAEGLLVKGWRSFADHHPFSRDDLEAIAAQALAFGCAGLITTEKDFVKIKDLPVSLPVWVLAVELQMEPDFDRFVLERVGGLEQ